MAWASTAILSTRAVCSRFCSYNQGPVLPTYKLIRWCNGVFNAGWFDAASVGQSSLADQ